MIYFWIILILDSDLSKKRKYRRDPAYSKYTRVYSLSQRSWGLTRVDSLSWRSCGYIRDFIHYHRDSRNISEYCMRDPRINSASERRAFNSQQWCPREWYKTSRKRKFLSLIEHWVARIYPLSKKFWCYFRILYEGNRDKLWLSWEQCDLRWKRGSQTIGWPWVSSSIKLLCSGVHSVS